jgi:hypothetical protein
MDLKEHIILPGYGDPEDGFRRGFRDRPDDAMWSIDFGLPVELDLVSFFFNEESILLLLFDLAELFVPRA